MFVYVYGVTKAGENRDLNVVGVGKQKVYTIEYRDIAALVSHTSTMACEPIDAQAHENVILESMKDRPVIPMGFGIIARNEEDIMEILERGYAIFKKVFEGIEQKIQIDVKVSWNLEKLFLDILKENAEVRKLREEVMKKPKEQGYYERIELGRMINSALEKKKEVYKGEISTTLSGHSLGKPKENKLTSDRMIMNLSFFVPENMKNAFFDKVDELERKYGGRLEILAVGPLPPYDFTKIEVRRVDFESVDSARKVLELGEEATLEEIDAAHRNLAFKYHPDRNPDPSAKEQFKRIEKSYDLLSSYCKQLPSSRCSFRKPDVEKIITIAERE